MGLLQLLSGLLGHFLDRLLTDGSYLLGVLFSFNLGLREMLLVADYLLSGRLSGGVLNRLSQGLFGLDFH